jgi:hypothetical protein
MDLDRERVRQAWLAFSIIDETTGPDGKPRGGSAYIHCPVNLAGTPTGFPPKKEKIASGEMKLLESLLGSRLAGLTPKPEVIFLPEEKTMHVDYRTKAYKVDESPLIKGGARVAPRYERGPDEEGFMLTARLHDMGTPDSLSIPTPPEGLHWKTEKGTTLVPGSPRQISWSLSYGAKADPAALDKLRAGLQTLTAAY